MKQEPTTATVTTQSTFETAKRTFETAYKSGQDFTAPLYDLAAAVAHSVLNKCIDPQRKTAADRETVSDNGHNPALVQLKRGIAADRRTLDSTRRNADAATALKYNADGDLVRVVIDKDANDALTDLMTETISDGLDLVHVAAVALLEQASEHATAPAWLDVTYTARRLSKRVYIRSCDSAAYRDITTTPIQEAYRACRKAVQDSRATATDPRNGYSYIEDLTPDGLDSIYLRMGRYADLGGVDCNGLYTTDKHAADEYETIVESLELTDRQAQVLQLRIQGRGYKAIATYLGVTQRAIAKTVEQIQKKATAAGYAPID